jgi:hypothetical protein
LPDFKEKKIPNLDLHKGVFMGKNDPKLPDFEETKNSKSPNFYGKV